MHVADGFDADRQRASVERALLRQFAGRVEPEVIGDRVRQRMAAYADAPVRNFVPVLVEREVGDELRLLVQELGIRV